MIIVRNENFKEFISRYPVTTVIVVINLLIFLYTTLLGGLTNPKVLYDLGGISLEYIQKGEYYRLISSAFIHDGFLHFIVNMGLILLTAPPIESLLGKKWFLLLFFVSVLGASIFNVFWSGDVAVV